MTFDPTDPGTTTPTAIDTGHSLYAVACTSVSQCVAVDGVGNVFVGTVGGTSGGGTPGGGTSGGGTSGGSTSGGGTQPAGSSPAASPPKPGPVSLSGSTSRSGQQPLSLTNDNGYQVTYDAIFYVHYSAPLAASAARARKPLKVASGRLTLKAHKNGKLKLKLTRTALITLRKKHKLKVTLKLTVSANGHISQVVTKTLTLHLAP